MIAQHTPGPWTRRDAHSSSHYIDAPGKSQLYFLGASTSIPQSEHCANATLIAAAPDLLDSLESVMDSWQYGETPSIAAATYDHARSVIAKAKGETL